MVIQFSGGGSPEQGEREEALRRAFSFGEQDFSISLHPSVVYMAIELILNYFRNSFGKGS